MATEDKHSRTEKPTARRKREARREGQVARTPEVVTWIVVLAGTYLAQHTVEATYALVERLWSQIVGAMSQPSLNTDLAIARDGAQGGLWAVAPALVATMAIALAVNLAQTRGLITFQPLKPTFSKLSPAKGIKRLVSPKKLWDVAKQLVRVGLLGIVAWQTVSGLLPIVTGNEPLSSTAVASLVAIRALSLAREVAAIGLVLAALDYAVQYRSTARDLRMTKHEIREETKASDGNPLVRGAIRRRQRQMARNRMISAVARADAVVINPTHYAVALHYARGKGAPKVVAKGTDFVALRIREQARVHKVPLVEDPPLARALYSVCELDQEIPAQLYEAVARLLTFIYSLKASGRTNRIDGAPLKPASPLLGTGTALMAPASADTDTGTDADADTGTDIDTDTDTGTGGRSGDGALSGLAATAGAGART